MADEPTGGSYDRRLAGHTTNRPTEDWGQFLGDVPATTAILDRFFEHAEILTMAGKSYRMRRRAGATAPAEATAKE